MDNHEYALRIISLELSRLTLLVTQSFERIETMSAALDRITQEVAETKTAVDSVLTLVSGMAQQIRDLKDDPAALELLANDLDAKQAEIAAAVSANTPS